MKVKDLEGAALDWAVGVAHEDGGLSPVAYSTDWQFGGPIIEREWIELVHDGNTWEAIGRGFGEDAPEGFGPTPLIAAMRCYVASKLGNEVEVPDGFKEF